MTDAYPTEAELDRLEHLVQAVSEGRGMNLERLDGYLSALVCTPSMLRLHEWLPPVFGADDMDGVVFDGQAQAEETVALLTRHRNAIAGTLLRSLTDRSAVHDPLLLDDNQGKVRANDWALGFLQGADWDRKAWADLLGNEYHGGAVLPMFALANEHDPDPEMRPAPIDDAKREELIAYMAAGLVKAYAWFEPQRRAATGFARTPRTVVREQPKIGRNEPCPCGSGRKYKHCHGGQ